MTIADEYLDENRFALARDAYRNALAEGEGGSHAFANLSTSENAEAFGFLIELITRYPEWVEARLALANAYSAARKLPNAMAQYTILLDKGLSPDEVRRIRLARYRVAVPAIAITTARDDFMYLWGLARQHERFRRLRGILVGRLAELRTSRGMNVLAAIRDALPEEAELRQFLDAKEHELKALSALTDGTNSAE
ncbi:hypothetical protein LVJ94_46395 [Pendulispora rubella]|uniref:Tetratricopeptide repeat protein n=1 Tax=Pendulispora rubella TaxID=2741070 RepID=A0ABZ2L0Q7_9BACT